MFRSPLPYLAVLMVSLALTTPLCEAASRARSSPHLPGISPIRPVGLGDEPLGHERRCSIDPGGLCAKPTAPRWRLYDRSERKHLREDTRSRVASPFESQLRVVLCPMEEQRDPPRQLRRGGVASSGIAEDLESRECLTMDP